MNSARSKLLAFGAAALLLGAVASTATTQGGAKKDKDFDARAAFNELKKLEGSWYAEVAGSNSGPMDQSLLVRYEVASDGSAVTEISAPGSPGETKTKYHLEDDELVVTHFCAMGNQPKMKLSTGGGSNGKKLGFAFVGVSNLENTPGYMVLISIHPLSDDKLETVWQIRTVDDEVEGTHTILLRRVRA